MRGDPTEKTKFEKWCERSGLKPVARRLTKLGAVLVAERYHNFHPDYPDGPHWRVLWAIERGGVIDGQYLYFRFGVPQTDRIAAAVAVAEQFMKDAEAVGRYTQ